MTDYLQELTARFNGHLAFREKRPGILQVFLPLFHEDGDMVDIFLTDPDPQSGKVRISDYGLTLMRLSYNYELDTPNKLKIFHRILAENGVEEQNGTLFLDADKERLYPAILQFGQTISRVANMQLYKREVVASLFFELLSEFIEEKLARFRPRQNVFPLPDRDDLEVPFAFDLRQPVYLFGVKDNGQARLVALSCREFQLRHLPFRSWVVHEDFDALSKKDRSRITNVVDKQFTTLDQFREVGEQYLEREALVLQ